MISNAQQKEILTVFVVIVVVEARASLAASFSFSGWLERPNSPSEPLNKLPGKANVRAKNR